MAVGIGGEWVLFGSRALADQPAARKFGSFKMLLSTLMRRSPMPSLILFRYEVRNCHMRKLSEPVRRPFYQMFSLLVQRETKQISSCLNIRTPHSEAKPWSISSIREYTSAHYDLRTLVATRMLSVIVKAVMSDFPGISSRFQDVCPIYKSDC